MSTSLKLKLIFHGLLVTACLALTGVANTIAAAEPEAAVKQNVLTSAELADGWIQLFDGQTLFGWSREARPIGRSPMG